MVKGEQRHLGFTGTSSWVVPSQKVALKTMLTYFRGLGYDYLHHGDCIEGDALAYALWKELGGLTHCHPPDNPAYRAFTPDNDIMSPPKPYLERNKDIVNPASTLIGCPKEMQEITRSGTWATIRYARGDSHFSGRSSTPTIIIFPDGSIKVENK